MSIRDRCLYAYLVLVGLYTSWRYAMWWFQPSHIPANWLKGQYSFFHFGDFFVFALLSFVIFWGLILKIGTWFTIWFIKRPVIYHPRSNYKVAFLTCYVPGKEPIEMLEATLLAMRDTDYPHDTWVLDEGNEPAVTALCHRLGVQHFSRKDIQHYNQPTGLYRTKTKAGNLNSWRHVFEDKYDIVAQVDMDHIPHKDYLLKQLGFFNDPKVGYVVIPQIYKNTDNWIARGAAEQTYFYYGPLQQGLYGSHMPFLIGTTHVYRVAAMKEFGGYAPTIAEDYLTSMHFSSHGWKGVYLPEMLAEGDGPTNWTDYMNQQMRWSYGLYEIMFKHTHRHFFRLTLHQKINLLFSELFYFSGLATVCGFILTSLYLLFGINSTNIHFFEWLIYALPAYLSGMLIIFFLHRYYVHPENEPAVGIAGILLGQIASIIYSVAFIKFIFGMKLTYRVTSKGNTVQATNLRIFTAHICILLLSIFTLLVSFFDGHDSFIMRFWAILTIVILTSLIFSQHIAKFAHLFYPLRLRVIGAVAYVLIVVTACIAYYFQVSHFVVPSISFTWDNNVFAKNVSTSPSAEIKKTIPSTEKKITTAEILEYTNYDEVVLPEDSLTTILDRVLNEYESLSGNMLTRKQRSSIESELISELPRKPLHVGDTVHIPAQELLTAVKASKE